MTIDQYKKFIINNYPKSEFADKIKFTKLIGDDFLYVELQNGKSCIYKIEDNKLHVYRREIINNNVDVEKFKGIFRDIKLNIIIDE